MHLGREGPVLGKHAMHRAAQDEFAWRIIVQLVLDEVGADAVPDLPLLHVFANSDDFAGHV